jgi:hypothetical protein
VEQQIELNRTSAGGWQSFTEHRKKVTDLLIGKRNSLRLCILGAGNCNDLDLKTLLETHEEIHLVDVDSSALARGVAQQALENHPAIQLHGGIDVTGALDDMTGWSPGTPIDATDIETFLAKPIRGAGAVLPHPFDVVRSTCVLSQLMDAVVEAVGTKHAQFVRLVQTVRAAHLHLLMHLVAPGGAAALITDIVSSDTCPGLASVGEEALPVLLIRLMQERNFFHGVNPALVTSVLRTDPVLNRQVSEMKCANPWLWNLGPRVYAVCAWKLRKRCNVG